MNRPGYANNSICFPRAFGLARGLLSAFGDGFAHCLQLLARGFRGLALSLSFLDLTNRFLHCRIRILHDLLGLFKGFRFEPLTVVSYAPKALLVVRADAFGLSELGFRFVSAAFGFLRALLKIGDEILQRSLSLPNQFARRFHNAPIQPNPRGNLERVRRSGNAALKTVRRCEGLPIELHRAVLNAFCRVSERLQDPVMSRCNRAGALLGQPLEDRLRQRSSLCGIGSCPCLVDEHERAVVGFLQHPRDGCEMRRERREVLLNGLAVAEVHE